MQTQQDNIETVQAQKPEVYILLPVHNRRKITLAFIECLIKQTYNDYHLILIDDGSKDGTAEAVKEKLKDVTIIRGKGNWWWAGSLQQGFNWLKKNNTSKDDFVLVMNDDTEFTEDFLETGINILKDSPKTILTATGYNLKTKQPQDSGGYNFSLNDFSCLETYDCSEMNCLSTRGMIMKIGDFLSTGGFYPRLIPHYLSDLEFTMRAHKMGFRLMIHKDFIIFIDFEATGYREIKDEHLLKFVRKLFSKLSASNPIYWSNFVLMHSPWKYKLNNLKKIWMSVFNQVFIERLIPIFKKKISSLTR